MEITTSNYLTIVPVVVVVAIVSWFIYLKLKHNYLVKNARSIVKGRLYRKAIKERCVAKSEKILNMTVSQLIDSLQRNEFTSVELLSVYISRYF